jgi:hypothetical protein
MRNGGGGLIAVDGDAHQLRAGLGKRRDLDGGGAHIGGVGVGHRLNDNRRVAADDNAANADRHALAARHDCGEISGQTGLWCGSIKHGLGIGLVRWHRNQETR